MTDVISYTFDSLCEAIVAEAEDDSDEFLAELQRIISSGESRCYGDLNLEIFDRVRTGSLTAGQYLQPIKPATWQGTRSLHIRDAGPTGLRRFLRRRTYEYCVDYEPDETATSEPKYYCEYSDTQFFVVPAPDSAYAFELREISQDATLGLGPTVDETWLSKHAGDLLFPACMRGAEMFLQSDPADVQRWEDDYGRVLPTRRAVLRELIRSDYSPVQNAPRTVDQRP